MNGASQNKLPEQFSADFSISCKDSFVILTGDSVYFGRFTNLPRAFVNLSRILKNICTIHLWQDQGDFAILSTVQSETFTT